MKNDNRTSEQAESLADREMEEAEEIFFNGAHTNAQKSRDLAIFSMLRAILLELRKGKP